MNREIGPELVWDVKPVGQPEISPDGRFVVWVQEEANRKDNRMKSRLWIANSDGSNRRPLTAAGNKDRFPNWSPRGSKVAFISDRGGMDNLWVIDAAGGEAEPLPIPARPLAAPVWSPDGTKIAVTGATEVVKPDALDYPGAPEPTEDVIPDDERPVVVVDSTYKLDGMGLFKALAAHIFVVDLAQSAVAKHAVVTRLTDGLSRYLSPAWSPDGKKIACVATEDKDTMPMDFRLWVVDVETKKMTLALDGDRPVDRPIWSPDGKKIAFLALESVDWGTSGLNIHVINVDGELPVPREATVNLTVDLDRPVGSVISSETRIATGERTMPLVWQGDQVLFNLSSEGTTHIYSVTVDPPGVPVKLTPGAGRVIGDFSVAGDRMVYTACSASQPDEIFVLAGDVETQISCANELGCSWAEVERIVYAGADDWEIEGWLMSPEGADKPPLVLSIHGGPSGMYGHGFMLIFQVMCAHGYAVLFTNPRGSQGYGCDFARAVRHDWGGKDYEDLMAGVDTIIAAGKCDPERLGVTGWSYGGFMTNWIVTHTDRFSGAVAGACVSNMTSMSGQSDIGLEFMRFSLDGVSWDDSREKLFAHSPLLYAENVKTPVLFLHGEADIRCPVGQSEEMYAALKDQSVPTTIVRYPDEFHGLGRPANKTDRYRRTVAWFDHYVKSKV